MGFIWNNQKVLLHGIKNGSVRDVKAQKLNKLQDNEAQFAMICVNEVNEGNSLINEECSLNMVGVDQGLNSGVSLILQKFPDVFAEPVALPPFRKH
ncbi:unnamed protein product, partial [Arabidopsis halleri]